MGEQNQTGKTPLAHPQREEQEEQRLDGGQSRGRGLCQEAAAHARRERTAGRAGLAGRLHGALWGPMNRPHPGPMNSPAALRSRGQNQRSANKDSNVAGPGTPASPQPWPQLGNRRSRHSASQLGEGGALRHARAPPSHKPRDTHTHTPHSCLTLLGN